MRIGGCLDAADRPARTGAPVILEHVHEQANNPDGGVTYGLNADHRRQVPAWPGNPAPVHGDRGLHPYATTSSRGTTYVADAGPNAILSVSETAGRVPGRWPCCPRSPRSSPPRRRRASGGPRASSGRRTGSSPVPTDVEGGPAQHAVRDDAPPAGPRTRPHARSGARYPPGAVGRSPPVSERPTSPCPATAGLRRGRCSRGGLAGSASAGRRLVEVPLPPGLDGTARACCATTNAPPGGRVDAARRAPRAHRPAPARR